METEIKDAVTSEPILLEDEEITIVDIAGNFYIYWPYV